ncbi:MAG TPA: hypothetical protein VFV38_45840 [Ktedonobacteraceae bacterium]|nr:hypothetical protein [Ktedonobacteraceae bacterium]
MPSFENAFLRLILNMIDEWPQLKQELSTCTTSEEAGKVVVAFLQKPDAPGKQMLLEQTFVLALAQIKPALLGVEVGIACRLLFEPLRAENEEELSDWRGNSTCALLVQLLSETHEPHGGLAWSDDLVRRGYPTVDDYRKIETLQAGRDYELASRKNTTLEHVANFGDAIVLHEFQDDTTWRPHRALAGLLFPLLGRTATHAVLFRIAQAGLLDRLTPILYPLGGSEAERNLAFQARLCDARASQSLGLPSAWHRYGISHLALAGLFADVVGIELARACMTAIDEHGTMIGLEPAHGGLPDGGEEQEWQWHCEERKSLPDNPSGEQEA